MSTLGGVDDELVHVPEVTFEIPRCVVIFDPDDDIFEVEPFLDLGLPLRVDIESGEDVDRGVVLEDAVTFV